MFFAFRRVLCSSCFGSFFASFLASIFCCFLDRFWGHFGRLSGVQLGHFWHRFLASIFDCFLVRFGCQKGGSHTHPRAHMHTLFSIDFSFIFACHSKSRPRAANSGSRIADGEESRNRQRSSNEAANRDDNGGGKERDGGNNGRQKRSTTTITTAASSRRQ